MTYYVFNDFQLKHASFYHQLLMSWVQINFYFLFFACALDFIVPTCVLYHLNHHIFLQARGPIFFPLHASVLEIGYLNYLP